MLVFKVIAGAVCLGVLLASLLLLIRVSNTDERNSFIWHKNV